MEDFRFPNKGNVAPPRSVPTKDKGQPSPAQLGTRIYGQRMHESYHVDELGDYQSRPFNGLAALQETAQGFNQGPFHTYYHQWQDEAGSLQPQDSLWAIPTDPSHLVCPYPTAPEEHDAVSSALCEALLATIPRLTQDMKTQHALTTDIQFILTPRRISSFITSYFKMWHPNGPFIHEPTFDPEAAQLPLLMSLVFMGAMYSVDDRELKAAKNLLDLVELYAFSSDVFAPEVEMKRSMDGTATPTNLANDWITFQHFQGGYLISVVQHWAGSRLSRSRAMECRYSEIIKV